MLPLSRAGIIGVAAACAVLAAGGLAAAGLAGGTSSGTRQADVKNIAASYFTPGTMNLLTSFRRIMSQGWIPGNSTLGQVDYGVELVSTNGVPATFSVSDFSVSAS